MKWRVFRLQRNYYSKTITKFIKEIKKYLKDNLKMIYIIGSSATDDVIQNWSDIDCILVISTYSEETIEIIRNISNSYKIKIGITIYSKFEFEKGLIDAKTYYYLLLYKENILSIDYKSDDLLVPKISIVNCINVTNNILLNDLHNCKRFLIYKNLNYIQIKQLFKKIYVIMKSMLIINGYRPKNYKETFGMFNKVYNYQYFDYKEFIKNYQIGNINEEDLRKYAFELIKFVSGVLS